MVTAELAVAIPVVTLVLALCLGGLSAAIDQIRCVDAARVASRSAARGDALGRSHALGQQAAPPGASVAIHGEGGQVRVVVAVRAGGWGGILPSWGLEASAITPIESPPGQPP